MVSLVCGCLHAKGGTVQETNYLMDLPEYKNVSADNILSLKIIRYTEAGAKEARIFDKAQISGIYNHLKRINILDESKMSCTDNTTIYSFFLKDGSKAAIEIECEWVVIKGKNYNFKLLPTDKK